jgi:hypothetical protein
MAFKDLKDKTISQICGEMRNKDAAQAAKDLGISLENLNDFLELLDISFESITQSWPNIEFSGKYSDDFYNQPIGTIEQFQQLFRDDSAQENPNKFSDEEESDDEGKLEIVEDDAGELKKVPVVDYEESADEEVMVDETAKDSYEEESKDDEAAKNAASILASFKFSSKSVPKTAPLSEHSKVNTAITNLRQMPFSKIYQAILEGKTLGPAAKILEVQPNDLDIFLRHSDFDSIPGKHVIWSLTLIIKAWPNAKKAAEALGENYNKPLNFKPPPSLDTLSLKDVYLTITTKKIKSASAAAVEFGVYDKKIKNLLAKFKYNNEALSFEKLKTLNEEEASKIGGDNYSKPFQTYLEIGNTKKFKLEDKTLAEIHKTIINTPGSINQVSSMLEVHPTTLKTYFGRISNTADIPETISYEILKDLTIPDAKARFQNAYENTSIKKIELQDRTFEYIHDVILKYETDREAAYRLGAHLEEFNIFFARADLGTEINFDILKKISRENAEIKWGAKYKEKLPIKTIDPTDRTLHEIHMACFNHKTITAAASSLGTTAEVLEVFFTKARYRDENQNLQSISHSILRGIKKEDAPKFFGNAYEKKLEIVDTKTKLEEIIFKDLCNIIFMSDNVTKANFLLGYREDIKFKMFLEHAKYIDTNYETQSISYEKIKEWGNPEKAGKAVGQAFNQKLIYDPRPLEDYTLLEIFKKLKDRNPFSEKQAAVIFAAYPHKFKQELSQFSYKKDGLEKHLDYKYLMSLSNEEDLKKIFPNCDKKLKEISGEKKPTKKPAPQTLFANTKHPETSPPEKRKGEEEDEDPNPKRKQ